MTSCDSVQTYQPTLMLLKCVNFSKVAGIVIFGMVILLLVMCPSSNVYDIYFPADSNNEDTRHSMTSLLRIPSVVVTCMCVTMGGLVWAMLDPILQPHLSQVRPPCLMPFCSCTCRRYVRHAGSHPAAAPVAGTSAMLDAILQPHLSQVRPPCLMPFCMC